MPYTRRASDIMQSLPDEPLFQVQVKHDAKPSVTNRILASMNNFLQELHTEDSSMPSTLAALRTEAGILLQITGHDDPHGAGFIPWRIAFYVVGGPSDLQNALNLLDSFFTYRKTHLTDNEIAFPNAFKVHLSIAEPLGNAVDTTQFANATTVTSPATLDPFEAAPPAGHKILIFSAEFHQDGWNLSGVFVGQTYAFRDQFEAAGIYGARVEGSDEYCRVLPQTNVGAQEGRVWFLNHILNDVLAGLVMQVRVTTSPPDTSPAADFLSLLLDQPQISLKQTTTVG